MAFPVSAFTSEPIMISHPSFKNTPELKNYDQHEAVKRSSYVHQLKNLFNLNGSPYSLAEYFPMEPVFTTPIQEMLCIVSGRQISKTTVCSARQITIATHRANTDILTVLPRFEQTRTFSGVVSSLIRDSRFSRVWCGSGKDTVQNVLQKSFTNNSNLYFSYAGLTSSRQGNGSSGDRVRGKSIDFTNYDESQDIDYSVVAVINETMSASKLEGTTYTGTPKTLTTTLQHAWDYSSQARWVIPCHHGGCNYRNVCDEHHLIKMIGGWRSNISMAEPGVVCSKCRKPIWPHRGFWYHQVPQLRYRRPGYHIPQVIIPLHYADPRKWRRLLDKMRGKEGFNQARLYNEVLGLPYDRSSSLVAQTDLENASVLDWHGRDLDRALAASHEYDVVIMSVDWSGGGSLTGDPSYSHTAVAIMGYSSQTGKIDVIYGDKFDISMDTFGEAQKLLHLFRLFNCDYLVHDYTGAGNVRETILIHQGVPPLKLWPARMTPSAKGPAVRIAHGTGNNPRAVWNVDKPRCIQIACAAIKARVLRFFKNDYVSQDDPGIIADFLAFVQHKIQTVRAGETYTILRNPNKSDDFAMAVCQGATALWHVTQRWPNFGPEIFGDNTELARDAAEFEAVVQSLHDLEDSDE